MATFDLDAFSCTDLVNDVYQLAILLYPPETFNEKFLLNVRNCMINLPDSHAVKKWLKFVFIPEKPSPKEQEKMDFATEILNSPFNLITDQKVKSAVIDLIGVLPRESVPEKLLLSYMYLMIGNITRSDNILKIILNQKPRKTFAGFGMNQGQYHRLATQNLDKIFNKLSRHPADRRTFELLNLYVLSYMNAPDVVKVVNDVKSGDLKKLIGLLYVEKIAPCLVSFLRLQEMSLERRIKNLRRLDRYPLSLQSQWVWPFLDLGPLSTEGMAQELKKLESTDPMWMFYLMEEERMADLYLKKGGTFSIPKKRQYLRAHLAGSDFMLTLYQLIELGDIDNELVQKTSTFLSHE